MGDTGSLAIGGLVGIIALMIIVLIWMPSFTLLGPIKKRFGILGFAATNIGMFVSATGTMVGPFVAGAAETRQNHETHLYTWQMVSNPETRKHLGKSGSQKSPFGNNT